MAEAAGFRILSNDITALHPGDKVIIPFRGKNLMLAVIGTEGVERGFNIIASHVDSPRLDLKPNPLIEDSDSQLSYFKTHYYGGLKRCVFESIQNDSLRASWSRTTLQPPPPGV
ncbi:m18 family aminopeptidase [Pelomyxa schiedti]|nr:m18 family aminopeptidase [Pelomyxa schiedti]